MVIDRRTFIGGLATSILPASSTADGSVETLFASNVVERDGTSAAVAYSLERGLLHKQPLPGRGHDLTYNRTIGLLVAFARRPGNFAVAFDYKNARPPQIFTTPKDRHFYGHGVFSADGRLLYTTENDFENAAGIIGVYDVAAGFRRIGEHKSYGLGPHDIALLSDGRTLVVANGGIETHPDSGRRPLNIATMQSSLAYIDRETGDLLERHELTGSRQKLSIRHLDVAQNDTTVFGCQFKGPKWEAIALVGIHQRGRELEFLLGEPETNRALRQYVSSIAVDHAGELAGVTSSRGQAVIYVDVRQRKIIRHSIFPDVSGVAAHAAGGFLLTGGHGDWGASNTKSSSSGKEAWSWDNHALAITS
ncbi:MAG: DUF1513 domain-containing protein [Pseudomonadota bacterium]